MYGKRHPKLAQLFALTENLQLEEYAGDKTKRYRLRTPFGDVWVGMGKFGNGRVISLKENTEEAPNYDTMWQNLDLNESNATYTIQNMNELIKSIYNYISQPLSSHADRLSKNHSSYYNQELLNLVKVIPCTVNLSTKQKESAAFLCGVLLLCESHEVRNPTGGKFERKAIKNVLRLAKNGHANPFKVVFNGEKGRYIPAHSAKQAEKGSPGQITGGQKQTQFLLRGETPISTFLEGNDTKDLKAKFKAAKSKFLEDYKGESKSYIQKTYGIKVNKIDQNATIGKSHNSNPNVVEARKCLTEIKTKLAYLEEIFNENNDENYMVKVKELPDFPDDAFIVQFKKLILQKNVSRINKLMNRSIK